MQKSNLRGKNKRMRDGEEGDKGRGGEEQQRKMANSLEASLPHFTSEKKSDMMSYANDPLSRANLTAAHIMSTRDMQKGNAIKDGHPLTSVH